MVGGDTAGCKYVFCVMVAWESFESGPESLDPGDKGEGILSFIDVLDDTGKSGT